MGGSAGRSSRVLVTGGAGGGGDYGGEAIGGRQSRIQDCARDKAEIQTN